MSLVLMGPQTHGCEVWSVCSFHSIGLGVTSDIRLVQRAHNVLLAVLANSNDLTPTFNNDRVSIRNRLIAGTPRC